MLLLQHPVSLQTRVEPAPGNAHEGVPCAASCYLISDLTIILSCECPGYAITERCSERMQLPDTRIRCVRSRE